jgi:predicted TIM-barrel fold metal-dependent hydrolase
MLRRDGEAQSTGEHEIFDYHVHALPPELFREFFARPSDDLGLLRRFWQGATSELSLIEGTIGQMDANGVGQALICGNKGMVLDWVEQYPERFLASFIPDYWCEDHLEAADRFGREIDDGKWHAMGELVLLYVGRSLNDPFLFPYYRVCEQKGVPVLFHAGFAGGNPHQMASPYRYRVEMGSPLLLQDVIPCFPKLKMVIAHMGWPFFDQALYMARAYSNVYLDTGLVSWFLGGSLFERMLREAVETAGSEAIVFGSDMMIDPMVIGRAIEPITSAEYLTENDLHRILRDNAVELLAGDG